MADEALVARLRAENKRLSSALTQLRGRTAALEEEVRSACADLRMRDANLQGSQAALADREADLRTTAAALAANRCLLLSPVEVAAPLLGLLRCF